MELVFEVDGGTFQSCRREKQRWKWEEQGFWYKKAIIERDKDFFFAFFFLGGKTLSKFGEGKEQSVEKVLSI